LSQHDVIETALAPYLGAARLTKKQLEQVQKHLDILVQWNARVNLTSVRDEATMLTRHFGESFFAAVQLMESEEKSPGLKPQDSKDSECRPEGLRDPKAIPVTTAIDLGSGAGFPGLPLAVYSPQVKVTLIESHGKKATFLKEAVRNMELTNVSVFMGRAEDSRLTAELVMMRAVEKFENAAKTAAGLVAKGGRLALLIGEAQVPAVKKFLPEFQWKESNRIPGADKRVLLVGRK